MATIQPDNPTIFEVSDPGLNLHSVMVRMSTVLASKYPNKEWGTPLSEIVVKSYSDQFPNYILVDFEPIQGSDDLFWIFQNVEGARGWSTMTKSKDNLLPAKFRGQVSRVLIKQDVLPDTEPTTLSGNLISSVVKQQEDTGKAIREEVYETIVENVTPLVGEKFAPQGTILATAELLVAEGTASEKGVYIAESDVEPTGDGKAVKSTATSKKRKTDGLGIEEGWPDGQTKTKGSDNLTPAKFSQKVTSITTVSQQSLAALEVSNIPEPAAPTGNQVAIQHKKVNDWRYERSITEEVISDGGPLNGLVLTPQGQLASTYESLVVDGTTFSASALVVDGKVDPLGNGKSVQTLAIVPEVFSEQRLSVQRADLLPARFKAAIPERTESTVQALTGNTGDIILTPGQLSKTEDRITVHKKRVTITSRDAELPVTLTTRQNYVDGAQAIIEEKYLPNTSTAPTPETGLLVIKAESVELGDGSSTTETVKVASWPELTGSRWDELLQKQIPIIEQYVAAGSNTSEPNTSLKPINEHRTLRTHEEIPTEALDGYYNSFPKSVNVPLPDELVSAEITWTESNDTGDYESNWYGVATGSSWSLSGSEDGTCHSSVTLIPELTLTIKQAWGRNTPAVAHIFFLKMPVTEAAILAKVGAARWPVFRPKSHVIALQGMKVGVQVRVAASAAQRQSSDGTMVEKTTGKGGSADFQTVNNTVQIPPTLHGDINLGDAVRTKTATADASIGWVGENFPSVNVVGNKTITATGKVSPNFLAATSPPAVPTSGNYLYDSDVEPYKWGYAKVYALTIDASNFA